MTDWLLKLSRDTEYNNQNLYFVIPPCTDEYRQFLDKTEFSFKWLYENFDSKNIIDLYSDSDFSKDDFYDWDHLNYNGAIKMTKKIDAIIGN